MKEKNKTEKQYSFRFAQKKRLAFIDFCLTFKGKLTRNDIIEKFEVGKSAATGDFNAYKKIGNDNIAYNRSQKWYYPTKSFKPLFHANAQSTLVKLAWGILDSFDSYDETQFPVEPAPQINLPNVDLITRAVQAILNEQVLDVSFVSSQNHRTFHQLAPHSIFDGGANWYLRAFDRQTNQFKSFELTRLTDVNMLKLEQLETEAKEYDKEWGTMVELHLVPHPQYAHPELIRKDFGMKDGVSIVKVRAATAGHLLRHWRVDCSKDAKLSEHEYQLRLNNPQMLSKVSSLRFAPGYSFTPE